MPFSVTNSSADEPIEKLFQMNVNRERLFAHFQTFTLQQSLRIFKKVFNKIKNFDSSKHAQHVSFGIALKNEGEFTYTFRLKS